MSEWLASTIRLSTPLIFAAMGGLLCERAGVATLCIEGVLLISAWAAATFTFYLHSPWLGLLFSLSLGGLMMLLHARLTLYEKADPIISGVAINLLASGMTPLFTKAFFGSATNSGALSLEERFNIVPIPYLSDIPFIGPLFFSQMLLTYLALLLPFVLAFFVSNTRWGLRLRAAGDGPNALETAGVMVKQVRLRALFLGGVIVSLGGAYLSVAHASQFTRDMSAGRGFIALTAIIFGKWRVLPTLAACLFFGLAESLQIHLQSVHFFGIKFPVQFIQAFPYAITLLVLVGFVGRARPPLAIGK